jgi:hypothetical protein
MRPATDRAIEPSIAELVGGFVAAEGTFVTTSVDGGRNGHRPSFTFAVALGATDTDMCELMRSVLGVGHVRTYPRRSPHFDDECVFAVRAFADLLDVIVPFMDEHLPPSHKRTQYLAWRAQLLAYDRARADRRGWSRTPRG